MLKDVITEDYFNSDGSVDFAAITDSLADDRLLLKRFKELDEADLKSFFHLLITNKCHKPLGRIFDHLDSTKDNTFNFYKVLSTVALKKSFISKNNISKIVESLDPEEVINLLPFFDNFNESAQALLEQSKFNVSSNLNDFRTDLVEQVNFLTQQELTDKANEIQQKLEFHFPDAKEKKPKSSKNQVKLQQSKDLTFSRVIERNLSFNLRAKKRIDKKIIEKINKKVEEEQAFLDSMILSWKSIFEKNPELFITQIEFLSPESHSIFDAILSEAEELDLWTKVELLMKTNRAFEGLELLEAKEKEILDKNTEAVYNYYYYKALFCRQIGMLEEAEKIFKALYEQKQNFRDVNFYLKD